MVLKSQRYGSLRSPELPYRIDLLRDHGWDLRWTDRNLDGVWARLARRTEPHTVPWVQALLTRSDRRVAAATLAIFESEAHGLALWRLLTGRRRPPLVVVSCWLGNLARAGGLRRDLYRQLYRSVDAVTVFSSNQVDTLHDLLRIPKDRIHIVRFGVDLEELNNVTVTDNGSVAAIGRDLGRDWRTLTAAAAGSGWHVELMTRARQVEGLDLPPEVRFHPPADRIGYLELLAKASVVVIPTDVREYPTGQSVLLEAMALGKACVVTDTPGMHDYVTDGVDAVLVPPRDPGALRREVDRLLEDDERRRTIGGTARRASERSGGAEAMWDAIDAVLDRVLRR